MMTSFLRPDLPFLDQLASLSMAGMVMVLWVKFTQSPFADEISPCLIPHSQPRSRMSSSSLSPVCFAASIICLISLAVRNVFLGLNSACVD